MAHLFTGKYSDVGLAYEDVVCINPLFSYGLSGYQGDQQIDVQTKVAAHEIGHNIGVGHVEDSGDCAKTIMNSPGSVLTRDSFCAASITEITDFINSNINNGHDCLDTEVNPTPPRTLYDFDADGKADIGVFRPSNTYWYIQQSTAGFAAGPFGYATDKLAPADYDNNGKTDIAVFRDGNWYIQGSSQGFISVPFGSPGDSPVPGDFDGDRQSELVVFRPSNGTWYTYNRANNQTNAIQFGINGDKPQIGDFDGDGKNDCAVFRPSNNI